MKGFTKLNQDTLTTSYYDFNTLTLEAFQSLLKFFESKKHYPSNEMKNGLYDILDNLSSQLKGSLQASYYISSLAPGVGKTSAIKFWLRHFLKIKDKLVEPGGILLCFDRYEEIQSFLDEIKLPTDSYGVLVSNMSERGKALNACGVGHENINDAVILFTTKQQIINKSLENSGFRNASIFHYQGQPRAVRMWDETLLPGRSLTVSASQIIELVNTVERSNFDLSRQLRKLGNELYECKNNDIIVIPDFELELKTSFRWQTSGMRKTAETLDLLAGKVAEVRIEGSGRIALDCIENVPDDFKPCLVTDASAACRGTYPLYERYNGDLTYITPNKPLKRYNDLTVNILDRSTSKDTFKNGEELTKIANDIAAVVSSVPQEKFLIVVTVENYKRIKKTLKENMEWIDYKRLSFLTWGRHTATNKFVDISHMIITSPLYYGHSQYVAGMRAAAVLPVAKGSVPIDQLQDFVSGEIMHHLLQVINRIAVRRCIDDKCPPSNVWIMASKKKVDIEGIVKEICPGCKVNEWISVNKVEVKSYKSQVATYIHRTLTNGTCSLSAKDVRQHFGVADTSNFRKTFLNDPGFMDHLSSLGIYLVKGKQSQTFFELNPFT